MRAISLWQPWASLWIVGRKRFETRHWETAYRGPLVVHAAQRLCIDISAELQAICIDQFGRDWVRTLPRGAILGTLDLLNCIPTEGMHVSQEERAQGDFTPGRFAWEADDRRVFRHAICFTGRQNFFPVRDEIIAAALRETA